MKLDLGIHTGFAVNRFQEPEVWTRIVSEEIGIKRAQLVSDLVNPFYPDDYTDDLTKRIKENAEKYDLAIPSVFSGAYTRLTHMVNPDERCREIWVNWFKKLIDIGEKLSSKVVGSQFALFTQESFNDPQKREFLMDAVIKNWQEVARYAYEKGFTEVLVEPMSIPREYPHTIEETKSTLERLNSNSPIPFGICLDIGHAPHPNERDPYLWIESLGDVSPQMHVHQTVLNKSNHSPFTDEYNKTGIIKGDKVIEALKKSGAKQSEIVLEINHKEHYDTEFRVVKELKESADYWKKYIKEEGEKQ